MVYSLHFPFTLELRDWSKYRFPREEVVVYREKSSFVHQKNILKLLKTKNINTNDLILSTTTPSKVAHYSKLLLENQLDPSRDEF